MACYQTRLYAPDRPNFPSRSGPSLFQDDPQTAKSTDVDNHSMGNDNSQPQLTKRPATAASVNEKTLGTVWETSSWPTTSSSVPAQPEERASDMILGKHLLRAARVLSRSRVNSISYPLWRQFGDLCDRRAASSSVACIDPNPCRHISRGTVAGNWRASAVWRPSGCSGAVRRLRHRDRSTLPLSACLFYPSGRSRHADRLRGRMRSRRHKLCHTSRRGPARRPADSQSVGIVPGAGGRTQPSGAATSRRAFRHCNSRTRLWIATCRWIRECWKPVGLAAARRNTPGESAIVRGSRGRSAEQGALAPREQRRPSASSRPTGCARFRVRSGPPGNRDASAWAHLDDTGIAIREY